MDAKAYAHLFQALANETRMTLLAQLINGEKTVSELVDATGTAQNAVSYHLKCLTNCGFVTKEANGNERVYAVNKKIMDDVLAVMDAHIENHRDGIYTCEILENR